jgi:hypothetical protein
LWGTIPPMPIYEIGAFARLLNEHSLFGNSKYEWVDSNHLKAANLAERVYKTPLTTKSHSLELIPIYSIIFVPLLSSGSSVLAYVFWQPSMLGV